MAQTVNGGGVDPVNAQFQRAKDGGNGLGIILRAPAKFPIPADGPGTEANRGDSHI